MSSSNFTNFLGLNQWGGADKPKRLDFNTDNLKIDNAFLESKQQQEDHVKNTATHVSSAEKNKWNTQKQFLYHQYSGDGALSREISLGKKPELCFVFALGHPLNQTSGSGTVVSSAVLTAQGCTQYSTLTSSGISVKTSSVGDPTGNQAYLNAKGVPYVCVYQ